MKITPIIHFSKIKFKNLSQKQSNKVVFNQNANAINCSFLPYFGNAIIHNTKPVEFKYSKISSLAPSYEIFDCDYDNLDEFCRKFSKKLNSQLNPISRQDLQTLINKIKSKTKAEEELIKEVLFQLTSFTKYNSLNILESYFKKTNISYFGIESFSQKSSTQNLSTNQSLNYLAKKRFVSTFPSEKRGIILDDFTLGQLEELKNSTSKEKREQFKEIIDDINNDNVAFFNIKGWDIKCSDGKYRSANMFQGAGFLESLTTDIIKRHQKGENLDEILYSDLEIRLKKLFANEKIEKELEIIRISNEKQIQATSYDILNNINKKSFSEEEIKEKIKKHIAIYGQTNRKNLQRALLKYLNEFSIVFSIDSLASSLVSLGNKIISELENSGCNKNEIQYVITNPKKSFSLITNMYAKLNEIPLENICTINDTEKLTDKKFKARVILDDMTITGVSQSVACNKLKDELEKNNITPNIYYATILTTKEAQDYLKFYPNFHSISLRTIKSFSREIDSHSSSYNFDLDKKIKEYVKNNLEALSYDELKIILNSLDLGFLNSGLVCEFPYMLPDNNSQIANSLFKKHLHT